MRERQPPGCGRLTGRVVRQPGDVFCPFGSCDAVTCYRAYVTSHLAGVCIP
jgi:hypothetical protein